MVKHGEAPENRESREACRADRRASARSEHNSYLPNVPASAEELIATIGLDSRHACSRRHIETFESVSRLRINPPQFGCATFPSAVPELAVDPGDAGDDLMGVTGRTYG